MSDNGTTTDYRFAPIPEAVLYDSRLSDKAVRIYGALMRHGLTTETCYPSHRRIGELIGCAQRSVQRPLVELEEAGWITRTPRHDERGDRISDGFVVRTSSAPPAHESADPPRADARTPRAQTRDEREQENESHVTREHALDVPEQRTLDGAPVSFAAFWNAYPYRRGSRAAAERAWKAATKLAPPVVVIEGAVRFAADPNLPPKDEAQFVKHASTWLRDRGWEDGPLPPRGRPRSAAAPQQQLDVGRADSGQWELVDGEWRLTG